MENSHDIENSVTEKNALCPEGVKEPEVISDKTKCGSLYESWIEQTHRFKCLTISFLFLGCILLTFLALHIAEEDFFKVTFEEPEPDQLTATLIRGGSNKRTCSDNEYGCCYVYKSCRVVGESPNRHIEFHPLELSVYEVEPQDSLKTNCPSLEQIIGEYNHAYNKKNDCGKYGCCRSIDVGCDNALHNEITIGNNENLVEKYLEHRVKKVPVRVAKEDEHGSNCWNHQFGTGETYFVNSYNNNFPQPFDIPWWVWVILGCCVVCWIIENLN